jgi:hypothetical protein
MFATAHAAHASPPEMYNNRRDSIGRFRTSNFYIHARQ